MMIMGLGNPGAGYSPSRHNAGYWVVDYLARQFHVPFKKPFFKNFFIAKTFIAKTMYKQQPLFLVKPQTYMNRSGESLWPALQYTRTTLEDLLVVCDTLDLLPGQCRLKKRGGSGGQKGLQSIIDFAGTSEFKRIFFGVGRPPEQGDVPEYVLSGPDSDEKKRMDGTIQRVSQGILQLFDTPLEQVMNQLNKKEPYKE